jgi:transposase
LEYHIIRHTKFIKGCGEVEADESYFGGKRRGKMGRGAMDKIPKVKVEIVEDVSAETILRETLKKVKRGSKKL